MYLTFNSSDLTSGTQKNHSNLCGYNARFSHFSAPEEKFCVGKRQKLFSNLPAYRSILSNQAKMSVPPMYQYQTQQPSYGTPMGYSAAPMGYSAAPMMQPYKSAYPAAYSTVQVVQSAQPMTVTAVAPFSPAPAPQPSPIKMPGGFVPAEVSFARLFLPVFSKATFSATRGSNSMCKAVSRVEMRLRCELTGQIMCNI